MTHIPDGVDLAATGVLGLAGAAAIQAVDAIARISGETVLVSGATGGVGAYAIQLVAARGATVVATAKSGEDTDFVRSLGASHTVDYTGDLAAQVRAIRTDGVDAVLHFAGDGAQLGELLMPGGWLASTLIMSLEQLPVPNAKVSPIFAVSDAATLDRLAIEVSAGRLRTPIQQTYALEQVGEAFAAFGAGTRGKLAMSNRLARVLPHASQKRSSSHVERCCLKQLFQPTIWISSRRRSWLTSRRSVPTELPSRARSGSTGTAPG